MTYRNDHDAAVARVNALQQEVSRLADENTKLRDRPASAPARRGRARIAIGGMFAALVLGGFAGVVAGASTRTEAAPTDSPLEVRLLENRKALETCIGAIAPRPHVADPRGPIDTEAIERTGAPCRIHLRDFAHRFSRSETERASLARWADAEDVLSNEISLLTVYYSSDPEHMDRYATAPQLWNEYDRALHERNALVGRLRAL